MSTTRYKNWPFLAINGCILAIFGLLLVFIPEESVKNFLFYAGILMLSGGALLLIAGINNIRRDKSGAIFIVESLVVVAAGIMVVFFPEVSATLFVIMTGIWCIILGIIQLVVIVNFKDHLAGKNFFLIHGLVVMGVGAVLLFNPFQWAMILIRLIGVVAGLCGVGLVVFSVMLRSGKERAGGPGRET